MTETLDGFQVKVDLEHSISPETYAIVHLPPPDHLDVQDHTLRTHDAFAEMEKLLQNDPRMQAISQLIHGNPYETQRVVTPDEIGEYGYFFDDNHRIVVRVNQENGELSLPAILPIAEITHTEQLELHPRTEQYRGMLKTSLPPPIHVAGLTAQDNTFRIINGNARYAAAKKEKIAGLPSWVYLRNAPGMPVRIPHVAGELHIAQRFADAMKKQAK